MMRTHSPKAGQGIFTTAVATSPHVGPMRSTSVKGKAWRKRAENPICLEAPLPTHMRLHLQQQQQQSGESHRSGNTLTRHTVKLFSST